MQNAFKQFLALAALLGAISGQTPAAAAELAPPEPIATLKMDGSHMSIDVTMEVAVPLAVAWEVLTDFDNMPKILHNLKTSSSTREAENVVLLKQSGTARYGVFSSDFESVRRLTLVPMTRIDSQTISGTISKMHSRNELVPTTSGVRVHYHAEIEVDFFLPPIVGPSAMRNDAKERFAAFATEMLKRHHARPDVAAK
jgi:carbon monoxide dehydrogenase subunit G